MIIKNNFNKSNLKTGDVIRTREKSDYMVMLNTARGNIAASMERKRFLFMEAYTNNLDAPAARGSDAVAVYRPKRLECCLSDSMDNDYDLIWIREKPFEITLEDAKRIIADAKNMRVENIKITGTEV